MVHSRLHATSGGSATITTPTKVNTGDVMEGGTALHGSLSAGRLPQKSSMALHNLRGVMRTPPTHKVLPWPLLLIGIRSSNNSSSSLLAGHIQAMRARVAAPWLFLLKCAFPCKAGAEALGPVAVVMLVCVTNAVIKPVAIVVSGRISRTVAAQISTNLTAVTVVHWDGVFRFEVWRLGVAISNLDGG
jgi:hypothetical protein